MLKSCAQGQASATTLPYELRVGGGNGAGEEGFVARFSGESRYPRQGNAGRK